VKRREFQIRFNGRTRLAPLPRRTFLPRMTLLDFPSVVCSQQQLRPPRWAGAGAPIVPTNTGKESAALIPELGMWVHCHS
jgi:hypothetical protein